MEITVHPGLLHGSVRAIASKSQAHRLLICAAFSDANTILHVQDLNRDIEATIRCLQALGASIRVFPGGCEVTPCSIPPKNAVLPCGESGSTLRFLLPVAGALGVDATFLMEGRLPSRPLSPLQEEMVRMGCQITRPSDTTLRCCGQLHSGSFTIPGNISSQFISGLLFAAALMPGCSRIQLTETVESRPYLAMTRQALTHFGARLDTNTVYGGSQLHTPGEVWVEGDWSNAAFFLAAQAMGSPVTVTGLDPESLQGDRAVSAILPQLHRCPIVSAADIPDLVPILAVAAAASGGATFTHIHRLRLKESDRVATTCAMLSALGVRVEADADTLTVHPGVFTGGTVDAASDHRIAMAAAIAATVARDAVTICGAQCVEKSYPNFFEDFHRLGGVL